MTTPLPAQLSPEMAYQALAVVGARLRMQAERTDIHAWRRAARAAQIPPEGDWQTWYLVGGRGAGKTYASAYTLAEWAVDFLGERLGW